MNLSVVFYIPNMIDYFRIILLIVSVFFKGRSFALLYITSISLDYFDGYAARRFGQISLLGGALDMIIDRVSTMVILSKISQEKPSYSPWCILYSIIDFMSHFIFFLMSAYTGTHHKKFSDNIFLSLYYRKGFLYFICLGSELCFILTYLSRSKKRVFDAQKSILSFLQLVAATKTFFHIVHFVVGILFMSSIESDYARFNKSS
ncbi:uncharacterized protein VICG_01696 [Vittaforma corneae ATCC 50505]|uniref:CDP-diacylglycerol--inositol 3-phosphatidyltransferase n=1 Tax=Vittaforma corneae (strain ATCC 50505) TaxID=993615 RepID=L2GKB6_VITCO|nr:uncharacterized protein VICG_01696 [Vittaforma corneae ATCC 50505]ELA41323.1 hypothetical protein VICG_01696 [Vittaforma corneae ATCC 50505]